MTDLSDLLVPDAVVSSLAATNKKTLFQQIGAVAARAYGLDAKLVTDRLAEREKLGSTGFGAAVAIPHGKLEELRHVTGIFVQLEKPIDFAAVDELPEALEDPSRRFALGVQWHPEAHAEAVEIAALVEAARAT